MAEELTDTVRETIKFLRKATAEMRQIADGRDPETVRRFATWPINARPKPGSFPSAWGSIDPGFKAALRQWRRLTTFRLWRAWRAAAQI